MKIKKPKPKEVRAVRIGDVMWQSIRVAAAAKDMRPSEFIRRIIEAHLSQNAEVKP
jgi:hypothetical protein